MNEFDIGCFMLDSIVSRKFQDLGSNFFELMYIEPFLDYYEKVDILLEENQDKRIRILLSLLCKKLRKYSSQVEELQKEVSSLKEKIDEKEKINNEKVKELSNTIEKKKTENDKLLEKLIEKEDKNYYLMRELKENESKNNVEIYRLKQENNKLKDKNNDLRDENINLKISEKMEEIDRKKRENELNRLNYMNSFLNYENNNIRNKNMALRIKNSTITMSNEFLRNEQQKLNSQLLEKNNKINDLEKENRYLTDKNERNSNNFIAFEAKKRIIDKDGQKNLQYFKGIGRNSNLLNFSNSLFNSNKDPSEDCFLLDDLEKDKNYLEL